MSSTGGVNRAQVALSSAIFLLIFCGTIVLSGDGLRILEFAYQFLPKGPLWLSTWESAGSTTTPPIVGDESRFILDPSWDVNASPTTRVYNWTVSEVWGQPGAIPKRMLVVNGMSPAPTIEANYGDCIIVNVVNQLENGTSLHWHGQFQNGTNYYDGTHGITQCGIPPNGGNMTYNFTVQNVGTYWWHAHYSTQRIDGLYGAMILHSPDEPALSTVPYDGDVVVLLSDLYNTFSQDLLWRYLRYGTGINGQPGDEPTGDGGTINGVSQARCAYTPATNSVLPERRRRGGGADVPEKMGRGPAYQLDQPVIEVNNTCAVEGAVERYAKLGLNGGKSYRLRLINAGGLSAVDFSIDGHELTIIEADGVSVEPRQVNNLVISVAQRYSVVVHLDQTPGPYWVRATLDESQVTYTGPNFNQTTLGILQYETGNDDISKPKTTRPHADDFVRLRSLHDSDSELVPIPAINPPNATRRVTVTVSMQYTSQGDYLAFFNNTSWSPLETSATLFKSYSALPGLYTHWSQFTIHSEKVETIDLAIDNLDDGDHPFHLHGHTFFVVGSGVGRYLPWKHELNAVNPMRRDTVNLPAYSFVVLRFTTDNPGLWAFHCHITWHLESGLMMQFASIHNLDRLSIPSEMMRHCQGQT